MYRNEDEFVRGQKIKIVLIIIMLAAVYLKTGTIFP